jgi:arylsulfatase A-like enzyme/predicted Zn-dependent protease
MITIDTVRADRIGAYGYAGARTDTIDRLAAAGRRFDRAYSPLPLTIPSHASMMTGKYPPKLGIRGNGSGKLGDAELTLAEILKGEGWRTAAAVSAFVTTHTWGFAQGFDAYFDTIPKGSDNFWHGERDGDAVVDDLLGWYREQPQDQPVFMWAHMYDAHFPYTPRAEYLELTAQRPYDAEIAFLDDQIQRLVDAMGDRPTLFVIAGDHGEGLGEHHELNHGMFVYDATQRVPLILSGAGVKPNVVLTPVSLVDLLPNVLDALGLAAPPGIDGVTVRAPGAPVYMESWDLTERFGLAPHLGVVSGGLKLIDTPRPELYDLVNDPGEVVDLSAVRSEEVERMRAMLKQLAFAPPDLKGQAAADPAVAAQLAMLGYVDGEVVEGSGPAADPKDRTTLIRESQQVDRLIQQRKVDEAVALLRKLIAENSGIMEFRNRLSQTLSKANRREEARQVLEDGLKISPSSPSLRMAKAGMLADSNRFVEASQVYEALARDAPYMPRIRTLAVQTLHQGGKQEEALALGRAWVAEFPDDRSLKGVIGALLVAKSQLDEALPLLEDANRDEKPEYDVANLLATQAILNNDVETAFALYGKETANHPYNIRAVYARARLAVKLGRWADLVEAASLGVEQRKDDPELWYMLVLGYFNLGDYARARSAMTSGLAVDANYPELLMMDANLLAKEGKREEGARRAAEAQAAMDERKRRGQQAVTPAPPTGAPSAPLPVAGDNPLGIPEDKSWVPAQ